jgi:hypothetical protein
LESHPNWAIIVFRHAQQPREILGCYNQFLVIFPLFAAASSADAAPLDADAIVMMKRTKSGEKETDIKPMIHSYKKDGKALTCVLSASPSEYLNPEYIAKYLGIPDCTILRTRVLLSDGETAFR